MASRRPRRYRAAARTAWSIEPSTGTPPARGTSWFADLAVVVVPLLVGVLVGMAFNAGSRQPLLLTALATLVAVTTGWLAEFNLTCLQIVIKNRCG